MTNQHMRQLRLLGVPMDFGQQRRGVDMGPSALRYAGLYERLQRIAHAGTFRGTFALSRKVRSIWWPCSEAMLSG